jgi:hypothetical protein
MSNGYLTQIISYKEMCDVYFVDILQLMLEEMFNVRILHAGLILQRDL